jgi:hypothetical protein
MNVYLAQYRFYWSLRAWRNRAWFRLARRLFSLGHSFRQETLNVQSLFEFLRVTLGQFVFAGFVAFALLLSELYLPVYYKVPLWRIADRDTYTTFLASISGIGGIFIGLYYAALTAVGSAIYSKAPSVIRTLLVRERLGTVYMRYLAFVTFLPLFLIGFYELDFSPIRLVVPLMILLSGVAIISFVQLGQRAFYFFDPTRLAYPIFEDLRGWIQRASVGGYRWDDKNFQNHARRQARAALTALNVLADMSAEEKHLKTEPLMEISIMLTQFLIDYEQQRRRIPSDSFWYGREYKQREWFETSDLQTQLATQTASTLQPEAVTQTEWLEDICLPMLIRTLQINLAIGNSELMPSLFSVFNELFQILAQLGEVKKAFGIIEKFADAAFATFAENEQRDEWYEIIDRLAAWPSLVLLAYAQSDNIKKYQRSVDLQGVNWQLPSTLYTHGFPPYLLPRLEWMRPRLQFESSVEGKLISPSWYQCELVAQCEAEQFSANIEEILRASERFYNPWTIHAVVKNHVWLMPFIVNRQKEYLLKLQLNFGVFVGFIGHIEKARILGDLPWPTWKLEDWKDRIKRLAKLNAVEQARQSARLATRVRPTKLPDFAGEFLHSTAEALIDALISSDDETFNALVPYYFFASLSKVRDLISKMDTSDWINSPQARIAAGPLSDLTELTGYALLFSDFHDNSRLWSSIRSTWDSYLGKDPSPLAVIAMLIALNETPGVISARGLAHTNWSTRVGQTLAQLPRHDLWSGGGFGLHRETIALHPSPLVRLMAEGPFFSLHTGTDIFVALYLFKQAGAEQFRPLFDDRGIERSLRRQEELYQRFETQQGRAENDET